MPATISVGRAPSNHIVVNQPAVSGSHALITFVENGTVIYTDNSTNGTIINGQHVKQRSVTINQGDQILLPGQILLDWATINAWNPHASVNPQPQPYPQPQPQPQPWNNNPEIEDAKPKKNTCGFLGFLLSIISFPLLFIPIVNFIGGAINLVAFVLSIIGMFRQPRTKALIGLIISVVGPIIVFLVSWLIIDAAASSTIDAIDAINELDDINGLY